MAINKKLIHFARLEDFKTRLDAGEILDTSIVFIKDAKLIWTHGTYYNCETSTVPNDEIWYTNGSTTQSTTPYDVNAFGVNIVSNTYDNIKECWVIKFDGDVSSIGSRAFLSCSSLITIVISNNITLIEDSSFAYCSSLTNINIPDSVTSIGISAFESCRSLMSVTIGNGVTSIGEQAFFDCTSLTSVIISNNIRSIGRFAFSGCTNLIEVYCNSSIVPTGGRGMFPSNVSGFKICVPVTNVETYKTTQYWSDYVDSIVGCVFEDENLVSGQNIKTINGISILGSGDITISSDIPIASDTELGGIKVGEGLSIDANGVLSVEDSEQSVVKPANNEIWYTATAKVTPSATNVFGANIVSNEWDSATGKGVITFDGEVNSIGRLAFSYCSSLTSITIGNGVTSIGEDAFYECTSLESVHITDIAAWCGITFAHPLYYAHNLYLNGELVTDLVIPDSVTSIGDYAFAYCNSLTSVTIPDSVTSIEDYAFYECYSLTSVYCKATTPPEGHFYMFTNNASGRKIYVPAESVEAYKTAYGWSVCNDYIIGCIFEDEAITSENINKLVSVEELTENDVNLLLDLYFSSGGGYGYGSGSASAAGLDEVINSTGIGDYDEENTTSE